MTGPGPCPRCNGETEVASAISQGPEPHRMEWLRHKPVSGFRSGCSYPLPIGRAQIDAWPEATGGEPR